jgi:hypothetical protein
MKKYLCVISPEKDRFTEIACPIKKGDIATWKETIFAFNMVCYKFKEYEDNYYFQASCFVELPDLSDEALAKEAEEQRKTERQQYEKVSSIFVEHFNCRCGE